MKRKIGIILNGGPAILLRLANEDSYQGPLPASRGF